jgi:GxxExxY protein
MRADHFLHERLTHSIIGAFDEVYNTLGFGFLEHLHPGPGDRAASARPQRSREVSVPVFYKGHELGRQRFDMVVDGKVIVEVKSTFDLANAAQRQLRSYLQGTKLEVGLLLHFGPKAQFYRIVSANR